MSANNPAQLADQLGLVGLAISVQSGKITTAEFAGAVSHIEGVLQRGLIHLRTVTIIPQDKEAWEKDVRPRLEQSFDLQLRAVAFYREYEKDQREEHLLKGLDCLKQSAVIMRALKQPGAMASSIQEALQGANLDSLTSHLDVHAVAEGSAAPEMDF